MAKNLQKSLNFNFSFIPSFRFSKTRQNWTIFGIFNELLFTQNVNIAHFARNVELDFFFDFQTL